MTQEGLAKAAAPLLPYDSLLAVAATEGPLLFLVLHIDRGGKVSFNPFDDQSTKAYEKDPQVAAMTRLTDAYLANDRTLSDPEIVTVERGGRILRAIIVRPFPAVHLAHLRAHLFLTVKIGRAHV